MAGVKGVADRLNGFEQHEEAGDGGLDIESVSEGKLGAGGDGVALDPVCASLSIRPVKSNKGRHCAWPMSE